MIWPLAGSTRKPDRFRRRSLCSLNLEPLEGRLVLSLVAVSSSDAKINQTSPVNQTLPSVAMDANGDYVVAWDNQVSKGLIISTTSKGASTIQPESQTDEIQRRPDEWRHAPSVAMDADGDFVVA